MSKHTIEFAKDDAGNLLVLLNGEHVALAERTPGRRWDITPLVDGGAPQEVVETVSSKAKVEAWVRSHAKELARHPKPEPKAEPTPEPAKESFAEKLANAPKPKGKAPKEPKEPKGPTVLQQMLEIADTAEGLHFRRVAAERGVRWESCYDPVYYAIRNGDDIPPLVRVKRFPGAGRALLVFTAAAWKKHHAKNPPEGAIVEPWAAS